MNKPLVLKLLLSTAILLPFTQSAYADCAVTGATGTGGEIVVCSAVDADGYSGTAFGDEVSVPTGATVNDDIDGNDGDDVITVSGGSVDGSDAIVGGNGEDLITLNSGSITATSDGIRGANDNDTIIMNGGSITTTGNEGIQGDAGNDIITINGGSITADSDDAVTGNDGDDTITFNGGSITVGVATDVGITGGTGVDVITVNGGSITGGVAIEAESGDDTIILGGDSVLDGDIDGGADTDTLSFAMAVPAADLAALQTQLAAAVPAGGTIIINGNTYTWVNFEAIDDNLRALNNSPESIPTLQEWALLLLIALLGLIGFGYTRKSTRLF